MLQHVQLSLPVILPLLFAAGAAASRASWRWPAAQTAGTLALLLSVTAAGTAMLDGGQPGRELDALAPVSLVMAVLVTFIGLVILRYSRRYLDGESSVRYLAVLQITLAAVTTVVLTDHLLVLLAAWVVISLALHHLLLFYPNRLRALVAAHKKFLFARLAEILLLAAVVLLHLHHGSWRISEIVAAYPVPALSPAEYAAAVLLAAAALIKCAQLPLHGWLIQVVEAPTPVSALLHAGIVNLGGYLLIRFGPLLMQATAAQWLVLVVAGLTAVIAALVMSTRISIKVKLAWSTCAQMGLMLAECALGLFELALLHLTAHSCYKAYSFLCAGSAVETHLGRRLAERGSLSPARWSAAAGIAAAIALGSWWLAPMQTPMLVSPWLLLATALTVLIAERSSVRHRPPLTAAAALAAGVAGLYVLQKLGAGIVVPGAVPSAGWLADAWMGTLVLILLGLHVLVRQSPPTGAAHRLSIWLFAGLYLDEWVTRTTLRLWPAPLPATTSTDHCRLSQGDVS